MTVELVGLAFMIGVICWILWRLDKRASQLFERERKLADAEFAVRCREIALRHGVVLHVKTPQRDTAKH